MSTTTILTRVCDAYALLVRLASSLRSPLLLVLRMYWGWGFFQTGKGKLGNLGKITEYFASLNIPFPSINAVLAGATECFGGLLLLAGLASRLTTIPLIVTMVVAYLTAERESLVSIFQEPDKFLQADPFLFLLVSLIVFIFGPGTFSLDYLLAKKFAPHASRPTEPAQIV